MNAEQFRRLRQGDIVFCNFSNRRKLAEVRSIDRDNGKAEVGAVAADGAELVVWRKYRSLDVAVRRASRMGCFDGERTE